MSEYLKDNNADEDSEKSKKTIVAGIAATESARISTQKAAVEYAKPDTYAGNRSLYDSASAKKRAKDVAFSGGKDVYDPYTGEKLVKTVKEAKALYGDDWRNHIAESDHIRPLKTVFEENKLNPWIKNEDIKSVANEYVKAVSGKFNNAKRDKSNKETVEDENYCKSKGVKFTPEGREVALNDEKMVQKLQKKQFTEAAIGNIAKTGHEAGISGAKSAGINTLAMSGTMNLVAVIKGEKDPEEAVEEMVIDTGKAVANGYVMSSALTVVSHSLSAAPSKFIRALAESNVMGNVVTAVMATGNTLKRFAEGEITTRECLLELGEKGISTITTGYSMAVGQTLIPIPIIGATIGALVGSALTSGYCSKLMNDLKVKELEHQERLRIISECDQAAAQARAYREELESYLAAYFQDYQDCFDDALSEIWLSFEAGDADGMIDGANKITKKLGGKTYFETEDEFKDFLNSDTVCVF